ncbi:MAG: site-2 protease family protein [Planctomycetota bacterium]
MSSYAFRLPFRVFGVSIRIDVSFLLILPLLAWLIAARAPAYAELFDLPKDFAEDLGQRPIFTLGFVSALSLFLSVLIHEFGHIAVAQRLGIRTKAVVLWFLGGMAQLESMPRRAGHEALIAIAGPLTSYAIAAVAWFFLPSVAPDATTLKFLLSYLLWANVMLGTFNLLPALPLDGGRLLRSLLLYRLSYLRATAVSTRTTEVLMWGLGIFGLLSGNLLVAVLALFVYVAARSELNTALAENALSGVKVGDLMSSPAAVIYPTDTIQFALERMRTEKRRAFPVVDHLDRCQGILTLDSVAKRLQNPQAPVSTATQEAVELDENVSAFDALRRLSECPSSRLLVKDAEGRIRGIATDRDFQLYIQVQNLQNEQEGAEPKELALK